MISIKTTLKCAATYDGALLIESNSPFSGVDQLALIVGMADKETRQLPTDLDGLRTVVNRLEYLHEDCLDGLQGIGWILSVAQLDALPEGRAGARARWDG